MIQLRLPRHFTRVVLLVAFSACVFSASVFSGSNASAQFLQFGGPGGVHVRAPFVAVDVSPWGDTRVRAPFTAVDTGYGYRSFAPPSYASPFYPSYLASPYGYDAAPFPLSRYRPYGRGLYDDGIRFDPGYFTPVIPRDYNRHEHAHAADSFYQEPLRDYPHYYSPEPDYYSPEPDYYSPETGYYSREAEDAFIDRLYPNQNITNQNRQNILENALQHAEAESFHEQQLYAAENLSTTISDTTLARSAAQLADGLAMMGQEGEAWLSYLAPHKIVRWVDAGSPDNDLLVDLIIAYDGVVANPQLDWVTSLAGFRETRHQLHMRIDFIESRPGLFAAPVEQEPAAEPEQAVEPEAAVDRPLFEPLPLPVPKPEPKPDSGDSSAAENTNNAVEPEPNAPIGI